MSAHKSSSASFQEVEKLFSTRFSKEWVAQWCCSLLLLYGKYHLNDVMSPFLFFFFLPSQQDNQKNDWNCSIQLSSNPDNNPTIVVIVSVNSNSFLLMLLFINDRNFIT
jgi:hypothetical protein